jgi:uncharacterized damage-inducible protein DinB
LKEKTMFKPLDTILPILETTPARWKALCETLPADMLDRAPADGEWSALDCLNHIFDTEKNIFPVRVRAFLAGVNFPAFNPDEEGAATVSPTPAALAAEFAALRAGSIALLKSLKVDDLPRTALHPELGQVTLEQLLQEWAAHDLNHTIQAEQSLMQPYITGCGPWRKYFADHDFALM